MKSVSILIILWGVCVGCSAGEGKSPDQAKVVQLGKVKIDRAARRIDLPAEVCLKRGILEYVLVTRRGAAHESLFLTDADPRHLQAALLLIGCRAGKISAKTMGDFKNMDATARTDARKDRPADRLKLSVQWQDPKDKQIRSLPVEAFMLDREKGGGGKKFTWAFTGSMFVDPGEGKEVFASALYGNVIGIWYDAACILNLPVVRGNPYRGDRLGFEVNSKQMPSEGTPVTLTLIAPTKSKAKSLTPSVKKK